VVQDTAKHQSSCQFPHLRHNRVAHPWTDGGAHTVTERCADERPNRCTDDGAHAVTERCADNRPNHCPHNGSSVGLANFRTIHVANSGAHGCTERGTISNPDHHPFSNPDHRPFSNPDRHTNL
jgi:hypothetical protein